MTYVKRMCDDPGFATCRTAQPQTTLQYLLDLSKIFFQDVTDFNAVGEQISKEDFHAKVQRRKGKP